MPKKSSTYKIGSVSLFGRHWQMEAQVRGLDDFKTLIDELKDLGLLQDDKDDESRDASQDNA